MIKRKVVELAHFKVSDEEQGIIEAIVSVFNLIDRGKDIIRAGAFKKSLERKLPKGVWMHNWASPIAKTLEAKELQAGDERLPSKIRHLGGLYIKGQFNLETQRGREAYSDLKFGTVDEFSIGYSVVKEQWDSKLQAMELLELELFEWSPVLAGMNPATVLIDVKGNGSNADEFHRYVKGLFNAVMAERTPSFWELTDCLYTAIWRLYYIAYGADGAESTIDLDAELEFILEEFAEAMRRYCKDLLGVSGDAEKAANIFFQKTLTVHLKALIRKGSLTTLTLHQHSEVVRKSIRELTNRIAQIKNNRPDEIGSFRGEIAPLMGLLGEVKTLLGEKAESVADRALATYLKLDINPRASVAKLMKERNDRKLRELKSRRKP